MFRGKTDTRRGYSRPSKLTGSQEPRLLETPNRAVRWITKPENAAVARATGGRGCEDVLFNPCTDSKLVAFFVE